MAVRLFIAAALVAAAGAIISQPHCCSDPSNFICSPGVLTTCTRRDPIPECPSCCCDSSENVEFYNPERPEPWCTAPPAVYSVKFVATWTGVCHPDYYFNTSQWSPATGASHNTKYQMWDACMDDVSPGVALVSQKGDTSVIEGEYMAAGKHILDTFKADGIGASGVTYRDLTVDKYHQWVSTVVMLVPSFDRMVGVADLRLCDGYDWKRSVKVCTELFSTATKSDRISAPMKRNSIQHNNCSFGYFEFTFKQYENSPEPCEYGSSNCSSGSRPSVPQPRCCFPEICAPSVIEMCPSDDPIEECSTCCCNSTDNIEFYNPAYPEPACNAQPAVYTVYFVGTWTGVCHPDYYFSNAHWSPPTGASHNTEYHMWDACMDDVSRGVALVSQFGATGVIEREYFDAGENILDTFKGRVIGGGGMTSGHLTVDKYHQWGSAVTMLAPSLDRMAGVADLHLCDGDEWKQYIKVCAELFSTATRSDRVVDPMMRNSIQLSNCSFGYFEFIFSHYEDSNNPKHGHPALPPGHPPVSPPLLPPGHPPVRPPIPPPFLPRPDCCGDPKVCSPRVLTACPRKAVISECSSCCCDSSENVEFYNPERPEPWCTAPPAVYSVKFVATWTGVCHPDYYFNTSQWSPPTGASHNTNYQMWDACMDDVSPGVALVSQKGDTSVIEEEYVAAGRSILDTFKASGIGASGMTSSDLTVDKYHQWVSTVVMLVPSFDRMVGVADLRLCDGHDWKRSVKVCSELFSTATKSERVHAPMLRNSIQYNNCSFGYFQFTFKQYENITQEPPEDCEYDSRDVCPPAADQPEDCRTCCCKSSDNVEFLHPYGNTYTECGAYDRAEYKASLIPSVSSICQPNYPFEGGVDSFRFSGLVLLSHFEHRILDKCSIDIEMNSLFQLIVNSEETLAMSDEIIQRAIEAGDLYNAFVDDDDYDDDDDDDDECPEIEMKRRVGYIHVNPYMSYVTLVSKLLPSANQWVGFSGLNLCGPRGWKNRVEVCLPLMAAVNRTENPDEETQLQGSHCSFARVVFERKPQRPATCVPNDESVYQQDIPLSACCYSEFIIEGQIIRVFERYGDRRYSHDLMVRVTAVHYDDINHIEVGDIVTIKVCSLPFRIKFKHTYRLTGTREFGSNELEISENGILANIPELENGPLGEGPCPPYIREGNCDDPIC